MYSDFRRAVIFIPPHQIVFFTFVLRFSWPILASTLMVMTISIPYRYATENCSGQNLFELSMLHCNCDVHYKSRDDASFAYRVLRALILQRVWMPNASLKSWWLHSQQVKCCSWRKADNYPTTAVLNAPPFPINKGRWTDGWSFSTGCSFSKCCHYYLYMIFRRFSLLSASGDCRHHQQSDDKVPARVSRSCTWNQTTPLLPRQCCKLFSQASAWQVVLYQKYGGVDILHSTGFLRQRARIGGMSTEWREEWQHQFCNR